jgi:protein-disulfide isomerase
MEQFTLKGITMRKLIIWSLCIVVLLGAALPAMATPVSDLTALAKYYPDTTLTFAAIRTDDAGIASLNSLIGKFRALLPPGTIPPFDLQQELNKTLQSQFKGDFKTVIRSWLGDTAAFGITGAEFNTPMLMVLSITDQDKALAFLKKSLASQISSESLVEKTQGDFKLLVPAKPNSYSNTYYAIGKDAMLISTSQSLLTLPKSGLDASADFTATLKMLPNPEYDLLAYVKTSEFYNLAVQQALRMGSQRPPLFDNFGKVLGSAAYGFTLLDDRTLVMDVAQRLGDTQALAGAGIKLEYPTQPIDPAFAARIPSDTPLVMQGTGLGPSVLNGFDNLRAFADLLQQQMQQMPDDPYQRDQRFLREFNLGNIVTFVELAFAGSTGLNLEKDVLNWMTGDYAMYLRLLPSDNPDLPVTPDFGFVTQATDPDAAAKLVSGIESALAQYRVNFKTETVGKADGFSIALDLNRMVMGRGRAAGRLPVFDLMLGADDQVLAAGTRGAVEYSLNPTGDSLADSTVYKDAQSHALRGATQFFYLDTRLLLDNINKIVAKSRIRPNPRDMRDLNTLLGLFESATVSATYTANEGAVARFALTLAEKPLPAPQQAVYQSKYANVAQTTLPDGGHVLGDPSAPATIVYFGDFACPHCIDDLPNVQRFIDEYVRTGRARLEFRVMTTAGGATTDYVGQGLACIAEQKPNLFWDARDLFFQEAQNGTYNVDSVQRVADQLGVDYQKVLFCIGGGQPQMDNDKALAGRLGVSGTPAVLLRVGSGDPQPIVYQGTTYRSGAVPFDVLAGAVDQAASGTPSTILEMTPTFTPFVPSPVPTLTSTSTPPATTEATVEATMEGTAEATASS